MITKNADLATIADCAEFTGLNREEMLVGVVPASKHERLLEAYQFGRLGASGSICATIVADIRLALQQGAPQHAADLLVVLRRLLAQTEYGGASWRSFPRAAIGPAHPVHG